MLKFISSKRASFVADRTKMADWLPVQVARACQAYNNWRQHVGAIVWSEVDVQVLIDLILQTPNTQDPIVRGPLDSFQKAGPSQAPSQHVKENKGRLITRGARKASSTAAARQRVKRQQWLGGAAAERQQRRERRGAR